LEVVIPAKAGALEVVIPAKAGALEVVIPAKAGIHLLPRSFLLSSHPETDNMDSRFRGNDDGHVDSRFRGNDGAVDSKKGDERTVAHPPLQIFLFS